MDRTVARQRRPSPQAQRDVGLFWCSEGLPPRRVESSGVSCGLWPAICIYKTFKAVRTDFLVNPSMTTFGCHVCFPLAHVWLNEPDDSWPGCLFLSGRMFVCLPKVILGSLLRNTFASLCCACECISSNEFTS